MTNLETLSLSQLVALHNQHAAKPVGKFSDRKTAIARTRAVLPSPKSRGMRFVFPVAEEIKTVRPGTSRAKLVELLSKGATFDECVAATWG